MAGETPNHPQELEHLKVQRVSVIVEMNVGNKRFILLLKNKSRAEFEIPGGIMETPDPLADGARELFEETQLDPYTGTLQKLPQHQDLNWQIRGQQLSTLVRGGKSNKDIQTHLILAKYTVPTLPDLSSQLSEHTDFMYVEIPQKWGPNDRQEYLAMIKQIRSKKLVYNRRKKGKVSKLNLTDNDYVIEGREPNISQLTSVALQGYLESRFNNLI